MLDISDIINRHGRRADLSELFMLENQAHILVWQALKRSDGSIIVRIFLDDEWINFTDAVFADVETASAFLGDVALAARVRHVGMLAEEGSSLRLHGQPFTLRVALKLQEHSSEGIYDAILAEEDRAERLAKGEIPDEPDD